MGFSSVLNPSCSAGRPAMGGRVSLPTCSAVQNVDESVASATAVDAGATATMDAPQCCIHIAAAQSRRDISDASVQQTSCVDPVPDFVLTQRCRRLSDCLRICAIGLFRILCRQQSHVTP